MTFATASDGTRLWYSVRGEHGDPIVLIAGQALAHNGWQSVINQFGQDHRVVLFDHRGVGQSDDWSAAWSTRDFAADVVAVLDAAGIGRAHVYGHSMGGRIAQWLAADAPERVGALALGATTVGDTHGIARAREATQALISGNRSSLLDFFYTPEWARQNPVAAVSVLPSARSAGARRMHFRASTEHDAWAVLPHVTAPTLVLHGSDDALCPPRNAHILAERIPGAQLHIMEGARHGYHVELPGSNDVVLAHFAGHRLR